MFGISGKIAGSPTSKLKGLTINLEFELLGRIFQKARWKFNFLLKLYRFGTNVIFFYLAASILECVLGLFLGDLFLIILYMGNMQLFFDMVRLY